MPVETICKTKKRLLHSSLKYFGLFVIGVILCMIIFKAASKASIVYPAVIPLLPFIGLSGCVWKLWQLRGDQSLLVLSPKGLQYEKWRKHEIPWSAIAGGGIFQNGDGFGGTRRYLYITLDGSIPMQALPKHLRKLVKRSRKNKQPGLLIDLRDSDTSPEQAFELLRRFRARYYR